jgi:hypothetical protein
MALTQLPGTMFSTVNTLSSAASTNLILQTNAGGTTVLTADTNGNLLLGVSLPIGSLGNSKLYASTGVSVINNGGTLPYFQTYVSTASTNLKTWRHGGDATGNYNFQTVNDAYSGSTTYLSITSTGQISCPNYIGITGTATTIATGISFLALLRDRGNGGTALVLYDVGSTPAIVIVSQTGGTTFTLSAPSATQIQLGNLGGGGGLTALGGSSRNPDNVNVLILQGQ